MEPTNHLMPTNLDQICYKKVPPIIESVVMRPLQRNPRYRIDVEDEAKKHAGRTPAHALAPICCSIVAMSQ
jgi:hypothetical protein